MKKFLVWLTVVVFTTTSTTPVYAITRSSSSSSHSTPSSRSSSSRSSSASSRSSSSATKPATNQSRKVGKAPLTSRTPAPKPHTYNGREYHSSSAPYTNRNGLWVFWWLLVVNAAGKKEVQCFDKDHKRISCDRDSKSYQKDW